MRISDTLWDEQEAKSKGKEIDREFLAYALMDFQNKYNYSVKFDMVDIFNVSYGTLYRALEPDNILTYSFIEKIYLKLMELGELNYK